MYTGNAGQSAQRPYGLHRDRDTLVLGTPRAREALDDIGAEREAWDRRQSLRLLRAAQHEDTGDDRDAGAAVRRAKRAWWCATFQLRAPLAERREIEDWLCLQEVGPGLDLGEGLVEVGIHRSRERRSGRADEEMWWCLDVVAGKELPSAHRDGHAHECDAV